MHSAKILVRPTRELDARRLAEIHIAAWRATYRGVMSDEYLDDMSVERATSSWARNIATPSDGANHLTVVRGDDPVGFAIFGPATGNGAAGTGQVYAINLHPDWWAQGIGSTLLTAVEQNLVQFGYSQAFLWVEKGNKRAISFYNKRGWLDDGGTLEDTRFNPPIAELRHSRTFSAI
jgi:ribosomal protein S18 acetylase RimI-like enzyme